MSVSSADISVTTCARRTDAASPFTLSSRRCVHVSFVQSCLSRSAFMSAKLNGLLTHFPWLRRYIAPPTEIDVPPEPRKVGQESRSEEHTSELQSHVNLVCRLLLEKKKKKNKKDKN